MSFLDFLSSACLILFGSIVLRLVLGFCLTPLIYFFRTSDPLNRLPLALIGLTNAARSYLSASLIVLLLHRYGLRNLADGGRMSLQKLSL
jgi:hypothetical protein